MIIFWALIVIFAPIILNPILLFIRFELYERKDWINWVNCQEKDERFFKTKSYWETDPDGLKKQSLKYIKIAEPRPTIEDFWKEVVNEHSTNFIFIPILSTIYSIYNVLYIIVRPLNSVINWLFNKFKDIKI